MTGLPDAKSLTERLCFIVGIAGFILSLCLMAGSVVAAVFLSPLGSAYMFFTGAAGAVTGLILMAISQALGSLRLLATHRSSERTFG